MIYYVIGSKSKLNDNGVILFIYFYNDLINYKYSGSYSYIMESLKWNSVPEAEGKHPIMCQESASGTHLERPELCNPSNNTVQAHLYS